MPMFSRKKDFGVQSFVLKMVNNNCPELKALVEGPRLDTRVNLVVVVMVVPLENKRLQIRRTFTAVTKEFSNNGVSVVLDRPIELHEVILGFRFEGEMTFIRADAKHLEPMGGGFYQLGFKLKAVVNSGDQPELSALGF
jgi:hypothetical protein